MVTTSFFSSRRIHVLGILAFACVLSFAGCKSTIVDPGAQPTGAFSGRVLLYDGSGNALALDTGVTISIGSAFIASTDDSGKWIIPALQPGTRDLYDLTFTRSGFGTVMQFNDSAIVDDTVKLATLVMSQATDDVLGLQSFEYIAPRNFIFTSKMPMPFSAMRSVVFCLSTDSAALAVNPSQAPWILDTAIAGSFYDGSFTFSSNTIVPAASLVHGTIIYGVVCVAGEGQNYTSFSHYYDPVAKREVYSALGPHSRVLAVKIP